MDDEKRYADLERQADALLGRAGSSDARQTFGQVFDQRTMLLLNRLIGQGRLTSLEYPVAIGKEANVFCAKSRSGRLAVKIFRTATTSFKNITRYIDGDPRFVGGRSNRRQLMRLWATKEFKNMQRARRAGLRVPRPSFVAENIIGMQFIGDATRPAPTFHDQPPSRNEAAESARVVFEGIRNLVREAGLVHADMSPYNILRWKGRDVIIDWGQAVLLRHPNAREFLRRDIDVLAKAYKRLGVHIDTANEFRQAMAQPRKADGADGDDEEDGEEE